MTGPLLQRRPAKLTTQTLAALLLGVLQLTAFWFIVHVLSDAAVAHPGAILLFPLAGVLFLAFLMPTIVFLTFESDFPKMNPLYPLHYIKIMWYTYKALISNNWKVRSKDL